MPRSYRYKSKPGHLQHSNDWQGSVMRPAPPPKMFGSSKEFEVITMQFSKLGAFQRHPIISTTSSYLVSNSNFLNQLSI